MLVAVAPIFDRILIQLKKLLLVDVGTIFD
jgi:hypothetical protein